MEPETDKYLTEAQVARLLGLSPRTLQAWRYRGGHTPQFIKVGRAVRYSLTDVKAWLRERQRRSTSDRGLERLHNAPHRR